MSHSYGQIIDLESARSNQIGKYRRNGKLQSCEPCRKSKLRCDHTTPSCGRCVRRKRAEQCVYHPSPLTQVSQDFFHESCETQHELHHLQCHGTCRIMLSALPNSRATISDPQSFDIRSSFQATQYYEFVRLIDNARVDKIPLLRSQLQALALFTAHRMSWSQSSQLQPLYHHYSPHPSLTKHPLECLVQLLLLYWTTAKISSFEAIQDIWAQPPIHMCSMKV